MNYEDSLLRVRIGSFLSDQIATESHIHNTISTLENVYQLRRNINFDFLF